MMKRLLLAFLVLLVLLGGGGAFYWHWAADNWRSNIEAWRQTQEREGYTVRFSPPEVAGFPFRHEITITSAYLEAPEGWSWQPQGLIISAFLWNPLGITTDLSGRHDLDLGDGTRPWPMTATATEATLALQYGASGQVHDITVQAAEVAVLVPGPATLALDSLVFMVGAEQPNAPPALVARRFDLAADGLLLPAPLPWPPNGRIDSLVLTGLLEGPVPDRFDRPGLELWRLRGGAIQIAELVLLLDGQRISADGYVTLDEELRPAGRLLVPAHELLGIISQLERQRLIDGVTSFGLRVLLTSLSSSQQTGQQATIAVIMDQGQLKIGGFALLRLSPVVN